MNRIIRSFSLTPEVVEILDRIPKSQKSKAVNAVLKAHLASWKSDSPYNPSTLDLPRIRSIVLQILAEQNLHQSHPETSEEKEKAKALSALAELIGAKE